MEWISVEDRLPEFHDWYAVVVAGEYKRKRILFWRADDKQWIDAEGLQVTHWMELPDLPKE